MKQFLIALQFLTIIPLRIKKEIEPRDFGKSLLYFPIVGVLIGLLLCLVLFLFSPLPNLVRSALILMTSIAITGGLHLDGFADTCDGFYEARPREKMLEIMRDAHVGVMGVIGIAMLVVFKFTIIASIPQNILWKSLIMMSVFARWSQVLACYISRYARKNGKARYFIEYVGKKELFTGAIVTLGMFIFLMHMKGVAIFFFSMFPIFLFISYIKKKIGGMTGDTIGAVSEVAEVIVLLFCL